MTLGISLLLIQLCIWPFIMYTFAKDRFTLRKRLFVIWLACGLGAALCVLVRLWSIVGMNQ